MSVCLSLFWDKWEGGWAKTKNYPTFKTVSSMMLVTLAAWWFSHEPGCEMLKAVTTLPGHLLSLRRVLWGQSCDMSTQCLGHNPGLSLVSSGSVRPLIGWYMAIEPRGVACVTLFAHRYTFSFLHNLWLVSWSSRDRHRHPHLSSLFYELCVTGIPRTVWEATSFVYQEII